jgi:ABC-type phosphate/phosphonate transport system ATPase subunit
LASFRQFFLDHPFQAAPVSADLPLISNLDIYLNLSLIKEYHENLPKNIAKDIALDRLSRLGLSHIAYKRNSGLSPEERFCAMLLRCTMVKNAMILIDRPYKIIHHMKNVRYIIDLLTSIDDLFLNCHIYDFSWMKEKYGDL